MRQIMDLKSYAVFRKLTADSELLSYLVSGEPVPVHVLEQDLKDLLSGMHEEDVETIISDYPTFLQKHVQMGFQATGDNIFNVNGEIAEPVIEAIELLHEVKRDVVVEDLITNTISGLSGEREVRISDLALHAGVSEFLAMTNDDVFKDSSIGAPNVAAVDVVDAPVVMDVPVEIPEFEIPEPVVEVPEAIGVDIPEVDLSFLQTELPESEIKVTDPTFEYPETDFDAIDAIDAIEDYPEVPEEEVGPLEGNAFKQAYDFLVDKIKELAIDERLPGLNVS